MINKYTIDLSQFNNGETDKLSFPTFVQCMVYGIHKLKNALENETCGVGAILISDSYKRNIVIHPSEEELYTTPLFGKGVIEAAVVKLEMVKDPIDGEGRFLF